MPLTIVDAPIAVLFDMDGTLVDSEKVWDIGLEELAAHYGAVLSEAARLSTVGTATADTMRIVLADIGQSWRDPAEGTAWLNARMLELLVDGLVWLPGARELLTSVRMAGLPTALVTNTARALTEVALNTLGRANFDVVVCGDEVPRTKPDPAPYRIAAAQLGVDPGRCLAIEDSPAGIASATGAGCRVVAVPNHAPLGPVNALVIDSLLDLDLPKIALIMNRSS